MCTVHVWEFSNIGKAPFSIKGIASLPEHSLAEHNPHAYHLAMSELPKGYGLGTCAVCGQALKNNALIIDDNGNKFSVGLDCVKKAGDKGLQEEVKLIQAEQRRTQRELDRVARVKAKEQEQRKINKGLTDEELYAKHLKSAQTLHNKSMIKFHEQSEPFITTLHKQGGFFCQGMAENLEMGIIPTLGAQLTIIDIMAKQHGRKNSKAFLEHKPTYKKQFNALVKILKKADERVLKKYPNIRL